MKNLFKKDDMKVVQARVRISAMFDGEGEGNGAYVLKSGLSRITNHSRHESGYVIDFREPVTWSRSVYDSTFITVCGFDIIHINEQLNHLMVDFIKTYNTCYNSIIHPFYIITDVDYGNERTYEMEIEYSCDTESKLKQGEITACQVFKSVTNSYFSNITECVEDGLNFKAKLTCRPSAFNDIKDELWSILAIGNGLVSNIEIVKNTKRKYAIKDHGKPKIEI